MRKLLLILIATVIAQATLAQVPTLQQKLYYTCKVWGFVKYYHSNVSTCHVNWDSVLLHTLPLVENSTTGNQFNDALDTMLLAAGPMALSSTYFPDNLPVELKRNRDWNWIDSSSFRTDVQTVLDTIRNNFRPHANCWVEVDPYANTRTAANWGGYLEFPYDTTLLNINTLASYPDENHRLLMMFKFWNIVRYFNPYNYVLDTPWDSTLSNYAIPIDTVSNSQSMYFLYLNMATALNDAHVYDLTYSNNYQTVPGFFLPYIRLKYIDSQYVVLKSLVTGINPGDAIISIDGLTTAQWENNLQPYYSSGNLSVFRRIMCQNMLGRQVNGRHENLVIEDSTGASHSVTASCISPVTNLSFFNNYIYPADSLDAISWTTLPCGVGYVNIGNISDAGADSAYNAFYNCPAIIVDIRNYPISNSGFDLAYRMFSSNREFAKLILPDVTYPGTYYWEQEYEGNNANTTPYFGKVIILMNEIAQSAAEYDCMVLKANANAVTVGSQTTGADGNVTWFSISNDLFFGFTSLGVFYPNGDSTQRIGIVPDSVVYPTRAGIYHHDDEVLDKALEIAGCSLNVKNTKLPIATIQVFPNPANDLITIKATNLNVEQATINIADITGRVLLQNEIKNKTQSFSTSFDIKTLAAGMYFITVNAGEQQYVRKIVKE